MQLEKLPDVALFSMNRNRLAFTVGFLCIVKMLEADVNRIEMSQKVSNQMSMNVFLFILFTI
jgi:hypothetical protein